MRFSGFTETIVYYNFNSIKYKTLLNVICFAQLIIAEFLYQSIFENNVILSVLNFKEEIIIKSYCYFLNVHESLFKGTRKHRHSYGD